MNLIKTPYLKLVIYSELGLLFNLTHIHLQSLS